MYHHLMNDEHGLLVGRFAGTTNSDDDFERYIASTIEGERRSATLGLAIGVLIVERGNPMPNAAWRRRIADETGKTPMKAAMFILCTEDPLIRGVLTAINWIRRPKYETHIVATVADAAALIRARVPAAEPAFLQMASSLRGAR